MGKLTGKGSAKRAQLSIVVIRADGRVDDFGVVGDTRLRWRFGPARLLSWWRIRALNRKANLKA